MLVHWHLCISTSQSSFPLRLGNPQCKIRSAMPLRLRLPGYLADPLLALLIGFLLWPWAWGHIQDLSGDLWSVADPCYHHQICSAHFVGVLLVVPHQWKGLFNPRLKHWPFGITPSSFKYYNYLLFKSHFSSLEIVSNIHFQPSSVFFPNRLFYQADMIKKHIFITIFSFLKNPDRLS